MRTVKYLTLTILLTAVLILSGTNQLLYTVNFAFGSIRAYYELQLSQENLSDLSNIANEHQMTVCIVENKMITTQEFDIYSTASETELREQFHIHFGVFRNAFYSNPVLIRAHTLTDYKLSGDSVRVYFTGNNQADFEKSLESHFAINGGITVQQDSSSILLVGLLAWGVLIAFAFFLSAFDAESKKRMSFVRILNGYSPLRIVCINTGIEIAVTTGIITIVSLVTNSIFTVETDLQFWIMSALLIIASALPYLRLSGTSYRIITQERLTVSRLLNFGYIYKTLLLCMTIAVFSLTASVGSDFFKYLRVMQFAKAYEDYSIIRVETSEATILEDIDETEAIRYIELTDIRIEEIYRRYYDSNHALMIEPYGMNSDRGGVIFCNSNAVDYIDQMFPEFQAETNDSDVCIFVPEQCENESYFLEYAKNNVLPYYAGQNWKPQIKVLHYKDKKTGFYLSVFEDTLFMFDENPVVVYVTRTPEQIGVPLTDTHKSSVVGMAFRTDEKMLRELSERDDINYKVIPIKDTVQQVFNENLRICVALVLVCVVFIMLNLFVSEFLIRMEYRLRAKEYCIKTVLGYTMWQKFGSFLKMSLLSVFVSGVTVFLIRNQLNVSMPMLCGICGGMLIVDNVVTMLYAVQIEHRNIVNCLKGGAL